MRWTLDSEDDFRFLEKVFTELGTERLLTMREILKLLESNPEITAINSKVPRSARYSAVSEGF